MLKYVAKRLGQAVLTLFIIITIIFCLLRMMPEEGYLGANYDKMSEIQKETILTEMGLRDPLPVQLLKFYQGLLKGDFGTSWIYRPNVAITEILADKAPISIRMGLMAMGISLVVGIPLGVLSAVKKHSLVDSSLTVLALFLASVPGFWLGLMLMLLLSLQLGLLPSSGVGSWQHYIMPVMTLALPSAAFISRLTRTTMLDAMGQDYIRTAKGKGAKDRRIIFGHALRNALIPVITQLGMNFAGLLGGAMITEIVFGLPGFGNAIVAAIQAKDVPLTMFSVVFLSTTFMLIMLAVDLIYAFVDPRIKAQYE